MHISLDTNIIVLLVVAATAWLLFAVYVEPRALARLRAANVRYLPQSAAFLAGARVLRLVFSAAVVAGAVVSLGAILLQAYLNDVPKTAEGLDMVVSARNAWEQTLGLARYLSVWTWIGAVVALTVIWWSVARSKSRRRWSAAIESRRRALASAIADISGKALFSRAREADASAVEELDEHVARVRDAGAELVQEAMAAPLIRLGDQTVSLDQLHELEAATQQEDGSLEVAEEATSSSEETIHER